MKASLVPCGACHRHVFVIESHCPFCGVALTEKRAERRPAPAARMSRAALFALGTIATSTVACGGDTKENGANDGNANASTTGNAASTASSTQGSSTASSGATSVGTPVYGAPATGGASSVTGSGGTGGEGTAGSDGMGGAAGASADTLGDGIGGVSMDGGTDAPTPIYGAPGSPRR